MIILLFYHKNILRPIIRTIFCDPSLEPSPRDGSNDGSQNMFLWRNMGIYPLILCVTPSYHWKCTHIS